MAEHTQDFSTVRVRGQSFFLTRTQRAIVKILWESAASGVPCVSGDYLMKRSGSTHTQVSQVFRGSSAWLSLVVYGGIEGTFRLELYDLYGHRPLTTEIYNDGENEDKHTTAHGCGNG